METITNALVNIGIAFAVTMVVLYIVYMIGLILVLRRLKKLTWHAFVPILNYYAQVVAINAPKSWFALSLPPYVGAVYAGSVAIRLGRIFNKGPLFSLTWLTLGAPVGMFIIGLSKAPVNEEALLEKAVLLDIKATRRDEKAKVVTPKS